MFIWILDTKGVCLYFKSFYDYKLDEHLVSGLLAALHQFIFSQFDEPIESIGLLELLFSFLSLK